MLDTLRSESHFGGLWATYTVRLKLFGKLVVDFLFVLLEVTAEAL